jgi:signal transduction histidine kinase
VGARAIQQRTAVVVSELAPDAAAEWMGSGLDGDAAARSWLSVPLIAQDRVLGVLDLWSTRPHALGTEHIELAGAVANQAAIAVENARLFREASSVAALEERQRLARELHDSVSQALYGIALGAQTARELLERDPAQAVEPVEYVVSLAEAGLAEMRALIFELRPESLATEGLVSALEKQAAATRARYNIEVETALGEEPEVPLATKETLYRVAQEAIHNTIKHAHASRIDLSLRATSRGIRLEVGDNGGGFDATAEFPGHLGIRSMRERAAAAGGTFGVESSPGGGTRLEIEIPAT